MSRTALIIGAAGSFGSHALVALLRHGWTVRALARDPADAARRVGENTPVEWVKGDATIAADVARAARGCAVIVHAANPPAYRNWRGLALPMLAATIAAAKADGARIVLPGSVYNFAPDAGVAIAEDAPQRPATRKGQVRVEMEQALRQASGEGAKALILRAGDFYGPAAPNSALGWLAVRRGVRLRTVYRTGASHGFAYLPDLAETLARLLDREAELPDFEVFHFAGTQFEGEDALADAIRRAAGDPAIRARPFPWLLVRAAAPFNTMFRELLEMHYLWERPIGLDQGKLEAFLGAVPSTPTEAALRATLTDMGIAIPPERPFWTRRGASPYVAGHVRPYAL